MPLPLPTFISVIDVKYDEHLQSQLVIESVLDLGEVPTASNYKELANLLDNPKMLEEYPVSL